MNWFCFSTDSFHFFTPHLFRNQGVQKTGLDLFKTNGSERNRGSKSNKFAPKCNINCCILEQTCFIWILNFAHFRSFWRGLDLFFGLLGLLKRWGVKKKETNRLNLKPISKMFCNLQNGNSVPIDHIPWYTFQQSGT